MARRLIVRTRCPFCGEHVEEVADSVLKREPHAHNAEIVVTRTGYKQYIHSSCWYGMIAEQKRKHAEIRSGERQKEAKRSKESGSEVV